mmetsp:Transcript_4376/g.10044  ORF Transcript_4376/g.10044 Transcript_4376/m.10044 type:complete len:239 (+) Transcript_4376:958-1674(+)
MHLQLQQVLCLALLLALLLPGLFFEGILPPLGHHLGLHNARPAPLILLYQPNGVLDTHGLLEGVSWVEQIVLHHRILEGPQPMLEPANLDLQQVGHARVVHKVTRHSRDERTGRQLEVSDHLVESEVPRRRPGVEWRRQQLVLHLNQANESALEHLEDALPLLRMDQLVVRGLQTVVYLQVLDIHDGLVIKSELDRLGRGRLGAIERKLLALHGQVLQLQLRGKVLDGIRPLGVERLV